MSAGFRKAAMGIAAAACLVLSALGAISQADSLPTLVNYQGQVTDPGGAPITGTVSVTFDLFDAAAGGTLLWSESHGSITVLDGVFDVLLGASTPLDSTQFASDALWLQLTVDGEVMAPRQKLTSVPTASRAVEAEGLAADSITGDEIQNGAITPSKLASECVEGQVIQKTATGWQCHSLP